MKVLKIFGVIVFAGSTVTGLSAALAAGSVANTISYLFSAFVCAGITYLLVRSVWIKPKKDTEAAALAEAQRHCRWCPAWSCRDAGGETVCQKQRHHHAGGHVQGWKTVSAGDRR